MVLYKNLSPIKVIFQALGGQTGITDLSMVVYDPSDNASSPVTMTELSNGLYEAEFTPDENGRWWVEITSVINPENAEKQSYLVGTVEGGNTVEADFATESTTQNINSSIGQLSGTDVINELLSINTRLDGTLKVEIPPSTSSRPVQILWDRYDVSTNNGEWQDLLSYTVPTGYDLNAVSFIASSDVANEKARVVARELLGTFNCSTDTFTQGDSYVLPVFASRMYLTVTSAIANSKNDTITITYTNALGVTGRTSTVVIPKGSDVGTKLEILFEGLDYGLISITNVTHSESGQAGEFSLSGVNELFYLILDSSGTLYQSSSISLGGIVVLEGNEIFLQYKSNSMVNNKRRVSFTGTLVEKEI